MSSGPLTLLLDNPGLLGLLAGLMLLFVIAMPTALWRVEKRRATFIAHAASLGFEPVLLHGTRRPQAALGTWGGSRAALVMYQGRTASINARRSGIMVILDTGVLPGSRAAATLLDKHLGGGLVLQGDPEWQARLRPFLGPEVQRQVADLPADVDVVTLYMTDGAPPLSLMQQTMGQTTSLALVLSVPRESERERLRAALEQARALRDAMHRAGMAVDPGVAAPR